MIVHIGFPKTGTTFLQKSVFVHCKNFIFLDYHSVDKFLYRTIFFDELDFDIKKEYKRLHNLFPGDNLLISYELLIGPVFLRSGVNRSLISGRLKKLGAKKVIISVRNQVDLIESLYRQYVNQGGTLKPSEVLVYEGDYPKYTHGILIKMFDYYKLIKLYQDNFGKENVLVFQQEQLKKNKLDTIKRIADFIGDNEMYQGFYNAKSTTDKNKGLSYYSVKILRFFNRFTSNFFSPKSFFGNFFTSWKIRILLGKYLDPLFLSRLSNKRNFIKGTPHQQKITSYFRETNKMILDEMGITI